MRYCLVSILALLVLAGSAGARSVIPTVTHPTVTVYSAGPGGSQGAFPQEMGLNGRQGDAITSVPGVLSIVPGQRWSNFVTAAKQGVSYTIKSVVLTVHSPDSLMGDGETVTRSDEWGLRLSWPLLYEAPGTTWTLTVLYGTPNLWDDDAGGPNQASYVHREIWTWYLSSSLDTIGHLLEVFGAMPFGRSQVPIISDEILYASLRQVYREAVNEQPPGQGCVCYWREWGGRSSLVELEFMVFDALIATTPETPYGPGLGIANTAENPAGSKLIVDAKYLLCICD